MMTVEQLKFLDALSVEYNGVFDTALFKNKLQENFGLSDEGAMNVLREYGAHITAQRIKALECDY